MKTNTPSAEIKVGTLRFPIERAEIKVGTLCFPIERAESEVGTLRFAIEQLLLNRGVSARRIHAMAKKLGAPPLPATPAKSFEWRAANALFYCARFFASVKANDWPTAAYFSCLAGREAGQAHAIELKKFDRDWARYEKGKNSKDRTAKMRAIVEAKIREKRGLCSAKEIFGWCRDDLAKVSATTEKSFRNWWTAEKMGDWCRAQRERVPSGPKRD